MSLLLLLVCQFLNDCFAQREMLLQVIDILFREQVGVQDMKIGGIVRVSQSHFVDVDWNACTAPWYAKASILFALFP